MDSPRGSGDGHRIEQQRRPSPSAGVADGSFFSTLKLPDDRLAEEWQRIIVPAGIKPRLLRYLDVLMSLQQERISPVTLALRRSLLLCGPPGTGKTSLARSLPHEWTHRSRCNGLLLLLDGHAIPSGERGGTQRNIARLFQQITEVASTGQPTFAVVDEVETLATNRADVRPETNPQDTVYGVNALIEGLDEAVRQHPNLVFLLTSNLPRGIDPAVAERTDFQVLIDRPTKKGRYLILQDALGQVTGRSLTTRRHTGQWRKLLRLTDGFSARVLRHLVVEGLTFMSGRPDPAQLGLEHLIQVAQQRQQQHQHHHETGGVYTHDYARQ